MRFASRIARLERRLAGGCAACLGRLVTRVWDEETEKRPAPVLCDVCGRDGGLYVKVVCDDVPLERVQGLHRTEKRRASARRRSQKRRAERA